MEDDFVSRNRRGIVPPKIGIDVAASHLNLHPKDVDLGIDVAAPASHLNLHPKDVDITLMPEKENAACVF